MSSLTFLDCNIGSKAGKWQVVHNIIIVINPQGSLVQYHTVNYMHALFQVWL